MATKKLSEMEKAFAAISNKFSETEELAEEVHSNESMKTLKLAISSSSVTGSSLSGKLAAFASGLDREEIADLAVLLRPAAIAAQVAGKEPVNKLHEAPAEFLKALDVRLDTGGIEVGGTLAATPTITVVTITTTVASHPVIGCAAMKADEQIGGLARKK